MFVAAAVVGAGGHREQKTVRRERRAGRRGGTSRHPRNEDMGLCYRTRPNPHRGGGGLSNPSARLVLRVEQFPVRDGLQFQRKRQQQTSAEGGRRTIVFYQY